MRALQIHKSTTALRLLWLATTSVVAALAVVSIPLRYRMLQADPYGYVDGLSLIGSSLSLYAAYITSMESAVAFGSLGLGALIAWKRGDDWFAMLVAITMTLYTAMPPLLDGLATTNDAWTYPVILLRFVEIGCLMAVFCLFPNGRFLPRWLGGYMVFWLLFYAVVAVWNPNSLVSTYAMPGARTYQDGILLLVGVLSFSGVLIGQVLRVRRHADAVEQQQMKWVLLGLGSAILFSLLAGLAIILFLRDGRVPDEQTAVALVIVGLYPLTALTLPAAFAVSILRYRLWEIDFVINRVIVYGGLTILITAIYAGFVGGLATLTFTQDSSAAGIVMATALVVVLWRPMRRGIQSLADQVVTPPPPAQTELTANVAKTARLAEGKFGALAWAVWAVAVVSALGGIAMIPFTFHLRLYAPLMPPGTAWLGMSLDMLSDAVFIIFATVGLLLRLRKPENPMGWWGLAIGLAGGVNTLAGNYTLIAHITAVDRIWPLAPVAAWTTQWISLTATVIGIVLIPLFFPDGRLPSWRWHPFFRLSSAILIGQISLLAFADMDVINYAEGYGIPNPLGMLSLSALQETAILSVLLLLVTGWTLHRPPQRSTLLLAAGLLATLWGGWVTGFSDLPLAFIMLGVAVGLIRRLRHSQGVGAQQIKWMVWSFSLVALFGAGHFLGGGLATTMGMLFFFAYISSWVITAVSLGVSLFQYRLYDIDLIINRTIVYGGMTAIIVGLYTFIVGGASMLLHTQQGSFTLALFVTGVIAVLFQPVRERLQGAVNRLMFGERDDPYAVLSTLGRQLQQTNLPSQTLAAGTETIAKSLKLPYAAIVIQTADGARRTVAASGKLVAGAQEWPLIAHGEQIGWLVAASRSPGERFTPQEQRLLADIAAQSGAVASSVRLSTALQAARERLVLAREEERRRIRRDLHDELGPALASQTFKLDAAIDLLERDPGTAGKLLESIKTQNQSLVADIRKLVYALRPPALDELGLAGALRAHVERFANQPQPRIDLQLDPTELQGLPAAVEVAAYRIALEGTNNVLRHAGARTCSVRLHREAAHLTITIADDGDGIAPDIRPGVGLSSMRERAEELGGQLIVAPTAPTGTEIRAILPIALPFDQFSSPDQT